MQTPAVTAKEGECHRCELYENTTESIHAPPHAAAAHLHCSTSPEPEGTWEPYTRLHKGALPRTMVVWVVIKLGERALALGVAQQGLGTHHDQWFAELAMHLQGTAQQTTSGAAVPWGSS